MKVIILIILLSLPLNSIADSRLEAAKELVEVINLKQTMKSMTPVSADTAIKISPQLKPFRSTLVNFYTKVLALVKVTQSENLISGARALIKNYGIGNVTPNTIIFGDSTKPERVREFSEIIQSATLYKKNVLVIKKSQESPDSLPAPAFIDIWWGGKNNNASLMLTLAYMLIQSKNWKSTQLRLRSMVDSEDERQGVFENLTRFIKSSRIDAQVDIVFEPKLESPLEKVVRYSKGSDFVFIGMKKPDLEAPAEQFVDYYQNILKQTKSLPFVVFALAGEDIEFHKIFS